MIVFRFLQCSIKFKIHDTIVMISVNPLNHINIYAINMISALSDPLGLYQNRQY